MSTNVRVIGSSEGAADNQFSMPRGICVCSRTKQVFVVDSNNNRVQVFDLRSLAYIRTIGDNHMHALAFAAAGYGGMDLNINDRVLGNPMSCCIDNNGCLYVSDTNSHRIAVFDQQTGELLRTISRQGSLAGFVNKPCGLALDLIAGTIYVADYHNHRVQIFDKDSGAFVRSIGLYGTTPGNAIGQFNEPVDVALDAENNTVLVADFLNDRIQVFHLQTGAHVHTIGGSTTGDFRGPRGICVDRGSNLLFIADRENHRIKLFNRTTYVALRSFTGGGPGPGMLNRPMEMCVSMEEGVLLVVDAYNHRVLVMAVEELQEHKFRLQARISSRKAAEEKYLRLPKASSSACGALLVDSHITRTRSGSMITLHFPELGPLCSVRVDVNDFCGGDSQVIQRTLPQLHSDVGDRASSASGAQSGVMSDSSGTPGGGSLDNSIMTAQAEAFMGVIASLHGELPLVVSSIPAALRAPDEDLHSSAAHMQLIVPSALALHSLLERKWIPRANGIPLPVIASLTAVLADLNHASVSYEEKARVVRAVTAILRGAAQSGTDTAKYVFASVLQSLQTLTEPCYELPTRSLLLQEKNNNNSSSILGGSGAGGNLMMSPNRGAMSPGPHSPQRKKNTAPSSPQETSIYLGDATYAHLRLLSDMLAMQEDPRGVSPNEYTSAYHQDIVRLVLGPMYADCAEPPVPLSLFDLPGHNGLSSPGSKDRGFSTPTSFSSPARFRGETSSMKKIGERWGGAGAGAGSPFATPTKHDGLNNSSSESQFPVKEIHMPVQQGLQELLDVVFRLKGLRRQADLSVDVATDAKLVEVSISALTSAAEYFTSSQQQEDGRKSSSTHAERKIRGGSNIWRSGEQMCVGDLVDAMDKEKCWFESIITEVRPGMNIKVHFMGWGSKWDDIIPIEELESRISILNSQTKNWRADLFEGGLIEIKCNEDTVHQKWMWGKIIAMSTEEEWVDVSYNFSNEPVILKRAKLYGETICPVGMHTKERSKAVLATIVRPPQKAEELVTKKAESGEDAAYQDREDELAWADADYLHSYTSSDDEWEADVDGSSPNSYRHYSDIEGNGSAANINSSANAAGASSVASKKKSLKTTDADHVVCVSPSSSPVDHIAVQVFQFLMQEVLHGVTAGLPSAAATAEEICAAGEVMSTIEHMSQSPQFKAAESVLKVLITGPHKKLLAPYFCRVIIFQCSLRTKVLAQVYLATSPPHMSTIEDCLFPAVALKRIQALQTLYAQLLVRCLGDYLSAGLLCKVLQRLQATIAQSALAVIASSFASQLCASTPYQLRQVLLHGCLHSPDRFRSGGTPSALRDVLSRLLSCSSAYDLRRIASVWIKALASWVLDRCEREDPQKCKFLASLENTSASTSASASGETKEADEKRPRPFALIDDLLEMLASARSASRLEFRESSGACHMAAEIAFSQAFSTLSVGTLTAISRLLALRLSALLDMSGKIYADVCKGTYRDASYSLSRQHRTELLDSTLDLVKISLTEHSAAPFCRQYEALLPARLLASCSSLVEERAALKELPSMPRAAILLTDIEAAGSYMLEFKKYLVGRLDRDELSYDDHATSLNLVFRSSGTRNSKVNICAVSAGLWPAHCTQMSLYSTLKLPAPLALIASEFEAFYKELPTTWPLSDVQNFAETYSDPQTGFCRYKFDYRSILQASATASVVGSSVGVHKNSELQRQKRLYWCHGSGAVDLALVFRSRERYTCTVNEPLAAVLLVIGDKIDGKCSASQLVKATNLTISCVQDLCATLCASKPPLLTKNAAQDESASGIDADVYSINESLLTTEALKRSRKAPNHIEIPVPSRGTYLLVEQERKWLESVLDACIVRCLKRSLVEETGSLLACVTSTSTSTPAGSGGRANSAPVKAFAKNPGLNASNAKTNLPALVPALSADELCLSVKKSLQAAGTHVPEPVSSKQILARCEVLTSTGLLRKVHQHRGPHPPEWVPAGIGLASMVGGGVHCVGYIYGVGGNSYSNNPHAQAYKENNDQQHNSNGPLSRIGSMSLLAEKGGRAALYPRLLRTLSIYHANTSTATVSLKHFTCSFASWVGDLALSGLASCIPGVGVADCTRNSGRVGELRSHSSSHLNAMQALAAAAERESSEPGKRGLHSSSSSSSNNGSSNSSSSSNDMQNSNNSSNNRSEVRRWTDPLQSSDIRSVVSALALVSGVCVTQLASLELQYQHTDMQSDAALTAYHSLAAPVSDFVTAAHMLATCPASELAFKLEEMDFYLLCFEALSPTLIRAALHLLYAISSEPCPAPESDAALSPQQLLARMRPHWRRKHAVNSARLHRVGVQLNCEELAAALQYVGSAEPTLQNRVASQQLPPAGIGVSAAGSVAVVTAADRSGSLNNDYDNGYSGSDRDRAEEKGVPPNHSAPSSSTSDRNNSNSSNSSNSSSGSKKLPHNSSGMLALSLRDVFCAVMELDEQASLAALAAAKEQEERDIVSRSTESAAARSKSTETTAGAGVVGGQNGYSIGAYTIQSSPHVPIQPDGAAGGSPATISRQEMQAHVFGLAEPIPRLPGEPAGDAAHPLGGMSAREAGERMLMLDREFELQNGSMPLVGQGVPQARGAVATRAAGNGGADRGGAYGSDLRAHEQTLEFEWARRAALLQPPVPPFLNNLNARPDIASTAAQRALDPALLGNMGAGMHQHLPPTPQVLQHQRSGNMNMSGNHPLIPGGHGYIGLNGLPLYIDPDGTPHPYPMVRGSGAGMGMQNGGGNANNVFVPWGTPMNMQEMQNMLTGSTNISNNAAGNEGIHGLIHPNMPPAIPQPGHFAARNTTASSSDRGSGSANFTHLVGTPMGRHLMSIAMPPYASMGGLDGLGASRSTGLFSPMVSSSSSNDFPTYTSSPRSESETRRDSLDSTPVTANGEYEEGEGEGEGGGSGGDDDFADIRFLMGESGTGKRENNEDNAVAMSLSLHDLLLMYLSVCDSRFREAFPTEAAADEREAESKSTGGSISSSPSTSVTHFPQQQDSASASSLMNATVAAMSDPRDMHTLGSLASVVPALCFRLLDATTNVLSRTVATAHNTAAAAAAVEQRVREENGTFSQDSLDLVDEADSDTGADNTANLTVAGAAPGSTTTTANTDGEAKSNNNTSAPTSFMPVFRTSLGSMLEAAFQMMDPGGTGYLTARAFDVPSGITDTGTGTGTGACCNNGNTGKSAGAGATSPGAGTGASTSSNALAAAESAVEHRMHQHLDKHVYAMLDTLNLNDLRAELNVLKAALPAHVPTHIALHMLRTHGCDATLAADAYWVEFSGVAPGNERYSYSAKYPESSLANASTITTWPAPAAGAGGPAAPTTVATTANILFSPLLTAMNNKANAKVKLTSGSAATATTAGTTENRAPAAAAKSFSITHTLPPAHVPKPAIVTLPRCGSCNMMPSSATELLAIECGHWHCLGCWNDFYTAALRAGKILRCRAAFCSKLASVDFQLHLACCADAATGNSMVPGASGPASTSSDNSHDVSEVHVAHLEHCIAVDLQNFKGQHEEEMQSNKVPRPKLHLSQRSTWCTSVTVASAANSTTSATAADAAIPTKTARLAAAVYDEAALFAQRARADLLELLRRGMELVSLCMRRAGTGTAAGGTSALSVLAATSAATTGSSDSTAANNSSSTTDSSDGGNAGSVAGGRAAVQQASGTIASPLPATSSTTTADNASSAAIAASRARTINAQATALIGQLPISLAQLHKLLHGPRTEVTPQSLHSDPAAQELADSIRVQIRGVETLAALLQVPSEGMVMGIQNLASTSSAVYQAHISSNTGTNTGKARAGAPSMRGSSSGSSGSVCGSTYLPMRNMHMYSGSAYQDSAGVSDAGGGGGGSSAGNVGYTTSSRSCATDRAGSSGGCVRTHLLGVFGVNPLQIYAHTHDASARTHTHTLKQKRD